MFYVYCMFYFRNIVLYDITILFIYLLKEVYYYKQSNYVGQNLCNIFLILLKIFHDF